MAALYGFPQGEGQIQAGNHRREDSQQDSASLTLRPMSPLARMLCLLVSVSLMLAPLSHAHAHVTDTEHEHISVHGGHDHLVGITLDRHHNDHGVTIEDHDATGAQTVVDLAPDLSKPNTGAGKFLQWVAILCIAVFALFTLTPIRTAHPPPRTRARPPSPYPHALPLLRGPPHSI
jgi:hypothetical protein